LYQYIRVPFLVGAVQQLSSPYFITHSHVPASGAFPGTSEHASTSAAAAPSKKVASGMYMCPRNIVSMPLSYQLLDVPGTGPKPGLIVYDLSMLSDSEGETGGFEINSFVDVLKSTN
jgi:hypothetical protein